MQNLHVFLMGHKNGHCHAFKNAACGAAHNHFAEAGMAIATHDQHIGI